MTEQMQKMTEYEKHLGEGLLFALGRGRCIGCELERRVWTPAETLGLQVGHFFLKRVMELDKENNNKISDAVWEGISSSVKEAIGIKCKPGRWKAVRDDIRAQILLCPGHNAPLDLGMAIHLNRLLGQGARSREWSEFGSWLNARLKRLAAWRKYNDSIGQLYNLSKLEPGEIKKMAKIYKAIRDKLSKKLQEISRECPCREYLGKELGKCLGDVLDELKGIRGAGKARRFHIIHRGGISRKLSLMLGRNFAHRSLNSSSDDSPSRLPNSLEELLKEIELELKLFTIIEDAIHVYLRVPRGGSELQPLSSPPDKASDLKLYLHLSQVFAGSLESFVQPVVLKGLEDPSSMRDVIQRAVNKIYAEFDADAGEPCSNGHTDCCEPKCLLERIVFQSLSGIQEVFDPILNAVENPKRASNAP